MKTKRLLKSIISIAMVLCITLSFPIVSKAATSSAVYAIFADNMLFQQNETSQIAGIGPAGATISLSLVRNNTGATIFTSSTTVDSAGAFEINITAPAGSYEEYTVNLYENGTLFRQLYNVCFGELWLASGQSNMQLSLNVTNEGTQMMNNGQYGSKWIRVLNAQGYSYFNGSFLSSPTQIEDIYGASWVRACDSGLYQLSAVAYHFAEKLQADLNMPVGVLSANLGGSSIITWLSRSTIEGNYDVALQAINTSQYVQLTNWDYSGEKQVTEMSTNFNMKIYPLRRFRISGMIWYQGETEIMSYPAMDYATMFYALQDSYTSNFGYTKGDRLPVILTELASYPYYIGDYNNSAGVMIRNYQFAQMKNARPSSIGLTTINDVPLDYTASSGSIHPVTKKPVGQRMAYAAESLVYNSGNTKSAPALESYYYSGNSIYVKMKNVGDGLVTNGKTLTGFSICGSNRVYVEAEAKIVSKDTVRVWSEKMTNPVAVSFKTGSTNQGANLYSTSNGNLVMPAETFNTEGNINYPYCWGYADWTSCETSTSWHNFNAAISSYYPSWTVSAGSIGFENGSAYSGSAGIHLVANTNAAVNLEPNINYVSVANNNITTYRMDDVYTSWSKYTYVSFMVRNNSSATATFTGQYNFTSIGGYFIPYIVNGNLGSVYSIPADGQWHEVIIDLEHQTFNGDFTNYAYSSLTANWFADVLRTIFVFQSASGLDLSIDDFRFGTENSTKTIYRTKETSHNFYNWYTITAPTCSSQGLEKRVCQNADCDYYETRAIATTSHTLVTDVGYPATCTTDGLSNGNHCSVCKQIITAQQTITHKGHTLGDWNVVIPASCSSTGLQTKTCSVCKNVIESEVVAKLDHTAVTDEAVEAKCTTEGLSQGSHCSVCKEVLVAQVVVPANGHTNGEWVMVNDSTCTVTGTKTKSCTVCKELLETAEIAKKAHKAIPAEYETEPTCTVVGKQNYRCWVCNKKMYSIDVDVLEHTLCDWEVTTPATFESTGLKTQKCSACKQIINSEVIEKLDAPIYEAKNSDKISIDETNKLCVVFEQGETDLTKFFNLTNCVFEYTETQAGFGTGTTVTIKTVLGDVIDSYKFVVIGDVTGDGYVDSFDVSSASEYINSFDEPSDIAYKKSIDVFADDFLDASDLAYIISVSNFE